MRLEFESNVSTVPFSENGIAENVPETAVEQTSERLREGIKAAQAGNRAEARQLLLRVTENEPRNENAWLWLASISEYPEELMIFLGNVLQINPENERAQEWMKQTKSLLAKTFVQRGIDASREGKTDFAKQCFYQAAAHDNGNEMVWLWLASVSDSAEEKVIHLNKSLQINPENEDAQTALKTVHQEMAKALLEKARSAADAGDKASAQETLAEVFRKSPEMGDAWMLKADLSEQPADKISLYEKVLEINSENESARRKLEQAQKDFTDSLLQNARAAADAGDTNAANELLAQIFDRSPEMEAAWMLKADLVADSADKILYYEKVLGINPENANAKDELGKIHQANAAVLLLNAKSAAFAGDSQAANEMLAEVLEKSPEMEDAWVLKSYLALGFDEKMSCYEKVLAINPDNEAAKSGLQSLREFMPKLDGGKDEAEQMAADFAEAESLEAADEKEVFAAEEESPVEDDFYFQPEESTENLLSGDLVQNEELKTKAHDDEAHEEAAGHEAASITDSSNSQQNGETSPALFGEDSFEDFDLESLIEDRFQKTNESAASIAEQTAPEQFLQAPHEDDLKAAYADEFAQPQHKPTQLFDKPADSFAFDEFAYQTVTAQPYVNGENLAEEAKEEVSEEEITEITFEAQADEESLSQEAVSEVAAETQGDESFFSGETVASDFAGISYSKKFKTEEAEQTAAPEQELFVEETAAPVVEEVFAAEEVFTAEEVSVEAVSADEEVFAADEEVSVEAAPPAASTEAAKETSPKVFHCPFCNVENDAQAFVCASCSAVLSMSDLEMLLANQNADREVLTRTVERIEREKAHRNLGEYELMFLGIGHINLKNLREGFMYLQEASHLNPNNVLLGSQVNSLAIRIDEIERQEEIHDAMPKGRTILVVDDSPTVRKLISGKLEKSGHEVVCAVDGMDALSKLGEIVPDLILLDITMPRVDGYQVCKLIRNNPLTKDIPVVMISGKDGFFDKVRGRMAGTTGYITKPFGPETLMKALDVYIKPNVEPNLDFSITPDA